MRMLARISIALSGSVLLALLAIALLIGAAIAFYRFTIPAIPRGRRMLLSSVRALSLVLLLLLLFEPIIRLISGFDQKPAVAVLIDDSQSMSIRDAAGDRGAALHDLLHNHTLEKLSPGVAVRYYPFSSRLQARGLAQVPDSLSFSGEQTDISNALAQLKDELPKENIQTVLLLSDGNFTAGKNPLYEAEGLGVPVNAIGIGDTTEQKDLLIERVVTNNLTYAESQVPVDVTMKSSGYKGENVEVAVNEGSAVIDRKVITLKEGTNEYPVHLIVEPKEEGTKKYVVSVSKLPGELTDRNNSRSFFMKVLKSRLSMLLLAGSPSPDVSMIRQLLQEDRHLLVHTRVQRAPGQFYEGTLTPSLLDSADCLLFVGFPTQATSPQIVRALADRIAAAKVPLFFVNSKSVDYAKLQSFSSVLPFGWTTTNNTEVLVAPSVPDRQKNHPLVTLEGGVTSDSWQQLPPLFLQQTMFHAKPEAIVLADAKLQMASLGEPLVAVRNIDRQKSFAVTGEGIWRWRLLTQSNTQTQQFLPALITNAVRWLTTKEDEKNVRIAPAQEIFTTAEPVAFTAQVYDDQLRPVDNAEVSVEITRGGSAIPLALSTVGNGRYEGSVEGIGEGDYTYSGTASAAGKKLGSDKGRFSVGQVNAEFLETKMNKSLLEQMAYRTGGEYVDLPRAQALVNDLERKSFQPRTITESSEIELWNWRYLAGLIIFLLALEWFLRKRSGML